MYLEKYNDPKTNIGTYIKEILMTIILKLWKYTSQRTEPPRLNFRCTI